MCRRWHFSHGSPTRRELAFFGTLQICHVLSNCPDKTPGTPMSAKLLVEQVSKRYVTKRGEVQALDDISLEVAAGDFVCLVGPSGCGKSTLLDIMAGLTAPDA